MICRRLATIAAFALFLLASLPTLAAVIRVRPSGNDANNGSAWNAAKKTIQAAVNAASSGDEVWVASGTYIASGSTCLVTLKPSVSLYGGFVGTEMSRDKRQPATYVTTLDGNSITSTVRVTAGATTDTVIDGFTIRNGATGTVISGSGYGGGVYCNGSSPTISNNTFSTNAANRGGAIGLYNSSARVSGNLITRNTSWTYGGAIYSYGGSPVINCNRICYSEADNGSGIYCDHGTPIITNNMIYGNTAHGGISSGDGSAICCVSCTVSILNNAIAGNQGEREGAVYLGSATSTFANNILADNMSGVYVSGGTYTVRNNCFFDNGRYDFRDSASRPDPTSSNGNIKQDPLFASLDLCNLHIQPGSPCVGAGDNSLAPGTADIDGQDRIIDTNVDIGSDESDGTAWDPSPVVLRVSPSGNDSYSGSSWALAKKTIQAAVTALSTTGGEVWVKAGTYREIVTIGPGTYLYGGFSGTETERSARDWNANVTTIQAMTTGQVAVTFNPSGKMAAALDGFAILGGVSGRTCAPVITNDTITGCTSAGISFYGSILNITGNTIVRNGPNTQVAAGGIDCAGKSDGSVIANNLVLANTGKGIAIGNGYIANNSVRSNMGIGIQCGTGSTVASNAVVGNRDGILCGGTVVNNTIVANSGRAWNNHDSSSTASFNNNIVAFNQSGVTLALSTPVPKNNCVYGNLEYDYSGFNPAGSNGNISVDPKLANSAYGDVHIQLDSPCINTGYDTAALPGSLDLDGQLRVQGSHVDIGADESDGTTWPAMPKVVRVSTTGNDLNDGSSWDLAKRTVLAALDASLAQGGEVWLKAGVYSERVTLYAGTHLYGGFAGTEATRSERNWAVNESVLGGGSAGAVVTVSSGCAVGTVDGLTIRGGGSNYGGGISCLYASPTIANNRITRNGGGGVYCDNASPAITGNIIAANTGCGIYCRMSSPAIVNNEMRGNSGTRGGAIYCDSSSPAVTNNTITGNAATEGGAMYCTGSSPSVSNNIIAFNFPGVHYRDGSSTWRNNDVYGNPGYNYYGISAGTGDIAVDPALVSREFGNLHVRPGSPCINAGWPGAPGLPASDMDGQPRVQGSAVDIGADESDGSDPPASPYVVVRVSPDGADVNDGSSWGLAKRTLKAAIDTASAQGGEVWVKAGAYNERITLWPYAYLYGGFAGTESARSERDWAANRTIIDGGGTYAVVTARRGHMLGAIDGFTIRNGSTSASEGGGVNCYMASLSIANNRIVGNGAAGIRCSYSPSTITNNTIAANYGGISMYNSPGVVTNNTITGNASSLGGGISCDSSPVSIANNIIAFNSSGIGGGSSALLRNNDVYGNTAYNYSGVTPGQGDISQDPGLVNKDYGDPHLRLGSPCIDAGWDGAPGLRAADLDCQARVHGSGVDIGADESDGSEPPAFLPVVVRVSPEGSDANDGSSWALAKSTIQAGLDAAAVRGGEVWVKAGTYKERVTLRLYTYLYGGFAGTETVRTDRNWAANRSIIDGQTLGSVVTAPGGVGYICSSIDGFTIRGGKSSSSGGGISCISSSPHIANNTITANTAGGGGGICCSSSFSPIVNNIIAGNSAADGGGIYCLYCSPIITGNTIVSNSATATGGIFGYQMNSAISNNIIAFNSSGIYNSSGSAVLRNNDVFSNGTYNYSGLSAGVGDICVEPRFVARERGNYHLAADSPCINAGWNDVPSPPSLDTDCQTRIQNGTVDIGADEWWPGIIDAKTAPESSTIGLSATILTAAYPDAFYIEADDRTSGIRVEKQGHGLSVGMRADVSGPVTTNADGERCIAATEVSHNGAGRVPPLAMNNRFLGGGAFGYQDAVWSWVYVKDGGVTVYRWRQAGGLSNIGLLITTCGRVTYSDSDSFYIDDGAALDDNSGRKGVKVYGSVPVDTGVDPTGKMVIVTGVSSCEKSGTDLTRAIRTRGPNDVAIIGE